MSDNRKSNKNSATEDELGVIHNLTTKLHTLRLKQMVALISEGATAEDVIGDGKALQAAGKWSADQNHITAAQPEMDAESELSAELRAIREAQFGKGAMATGDNVVQFDDSANYS